MLKTTPHGLGAGALLSLAAAATPAFANYGHCSEEPNSADCRSYNMPACRRPRARPLSRSCTSRSSMPIATSLHRARCRRKASARIANAPLPVRERGIQATVAGACFSWAKAQSSQGISASRSLSLHRGPGPDAQARRARIDARRYPWRRSQRSSSAAIRAGNASRIVGRQRQHLGIDDLETGARCWSASAARARGNPPTACAPPNRRSTAAFASERAMVPATPPTLSTQSSASR